MDKPGTTNPGVILLVLWTLQGLACVLWLTILPAAARSSVLSPILTGISTVLTVACGCAAFFSRRAKFNCEPAQHDALYILALLVAILTPAALVIIIALGQTSNPGLGAYAGNFVPPACWLTLGAIELLLWLIWSERSAIIAAFRQAGVDTWGELRAASITYLVLGGLVVFVLATGLGSTPKDFGSWGLPATPLLEWQILLALAVSLTIPALGLRWRLMTRDRLAAPLVYLFTCVLWLSQPINPGFFATAPRLPNFEIYPFSDALTYAQYAQSALAGHGFLWPDVPTRPLYVAFLTWLHALAGQDYARTIILQTLVLAAFPAVLYLLGKEIGGRPLGIGLALLAAFRDLTSNATAAFTLNYTYSKLYFSELPAALMISLFLLLAVRWMRRPGAGWFPFLAGGILGLAALIRLQSAVILLAVIPLGYFVIENRRRWLIGSAFMTLGVALALVPWLARNYVATGGLVLDNPLSQTLVLAQRWAGYDSSPHLPVLPGESMAAYSGRMIGVALQSMHDDPGRILGAAANHFANNEIGNLLIFPVRDGLYSPAELIWPEHAFWQTWTGRPTPAQIPAIVFYVFIFGLGVATAFARQRVLGLLPLAASLAYNLWTALFLSSGDRFLVPIDWAVYLYHFLGLLTLAGLILSGLRAVRRILPAWYAQTESGVSDAKPENPTSWRRIMLTGAAILCMGASVPLTELAFPTSPPISAPTLAAGPDQILLFGRAIYPRWYKAGKGEPGTAKLGYGKSDQARLVFFLIGERSTLVIFPTRTVPAYFPNTSDVAILGTQELNFVRAERIVLNRDGATFEYGP